MMVREKTKKREGAEGKSCGRKSEERCGWKIQACSSVGGLYHSNALSDESRCKQRWGGERGGEGTPETRRNIREREHDKNNEGMEGKKEREGCRDSQRQCSHHAAS